MSTDTEIERLRQGRIVVVGASLAGLRAAETLRDQGFTGSLTMIGDEPYEPYDRPPLSKQALLGRARPEDTALPRRRDVDAAWRLGVAAEGLDRDAKEVRLANGDTVSYDRLLIATGTRARPWIHPEEAALDGVFVLRTRDDSTHLHRKLTSGVSRVLVIGAGFTGSEVASACRELGLEVTVAERGPAPLVGALGGVIGAAADRLQRSKGVDLRCGVSVTALEGDYGGRLRRAHLSDGTAIDAEVAVISLGAVRNTEWLAGSGVAAGPRGVACDAGCRVFDVNGIVTDDVYAAGDVARSPHPLFDYQFLSLEHWGNAVEQAEIAAHNMICAGTKRIPHLWVPMFWSSQFGINIKSVGVPPLGDQLVVTQGSLTEERFVAVYGYRGRVIAAATFDGAKWLGFYQEQIAAGAPFPPEYRTVDRRTEMLQPVDPDFPDPHLPTHGPTVTLSGHSPSERRVRFVPSRA
ncbi:FAD-dependent oxidoreductase [Streptomyces albulus]|uniref:NAD(P)/FAD-dependent oxidoreductase n=1 Tax=Streptomyces TaxID=1883 RepID=UPI001F165083|nr:FAD-dependent oxidoreductase [Streptomyces noursei]MCE4946597.1 FAD-dependent oxidoreductase [Streptomyces noursei]